jgi:hypothetical protein
LRCRPAETRPPDVMPDLGCPHVRPPVCTFAQENMEAERMEMRALNSERFRHRFLERSRPWILQHLTELLTPRTLQMPGADGRPVVEYVRDVYNDLVNMGEGMRAKGDRSDISSDDPGEEEYMEKLRREWAKKPLSKVSAALARLWLLKARKRQTYLALAQPIMDMSLKEVCELCERTRESGAVMRVDIAKEKRPNPARFDEIVQEFEASQGDAPFDPVLWKAFFRANAEFITRCNFCFDMLKQQERAQRQAKASRNYTGPVRAVDISDDDDMEAPTFPPLVVSRTTPGAKVVYKWLTAARRRLGGVFPRPHARDEMESHAKSLRNARINRAKRLAEKKAAEDAGVVENPAARFGKLRLNEASKALARLWLRNGQISLQRRRREVSDHLRVEVDTFLAMLKPEDDWCVFASRSQREGGMEEGVTCANKTCVCLCEGELGEFTCV